jgi:hypothetical protein
LKSAGRDKRRRLSYDDQRNDSSNRDGKTSERKSKETISPHRKVVEVKYCEIDHGEDKLKEVKDKDGGMAEDASKTVDSRCSSDKEQTSSSKPQRRYSHESTGNKEKTTTGRKDQTSHEKSSKLDSTRSSKTEPSKLDKSRKAEKKSEVKVVSTRAEKEVSKRRADEVSKEVSKKRADEVSKEVSTRRHSERVSGHSRVDYKALSRGNEGGKSSGLQDNTASHIDKHSSSVKRRRDSSTSYTVSSPIANRTRTGHSDSKRQRSSYRSDRK